MTERDIKETKSMNAGIWRGRGVVLAIGVALLSACGGAATPGPGAAEPGVGGERPREDTDTRAATMYIAQASLTEGEAAHRRYEQALTSALAAIERDPTNPRAYMLAGEASVGVRDWEQADTMFARAEELSPRLAEEIEAEREDGWVVAYNLGAEALGAGDVSGAVPHFAGADRLYQGRPEARMALALLAVRQGDTEAAIRAYQGALEILDQPAAPEIPEEQIEAWERDREMATFNLANLLAQVQRFDEAAATITRFLDDAPEDLDPAMRLQAMTARATFLAQAGREAEAEALYQELMARGDLGADEYFQIGVGLFNAGDFNAAADAFGTAARLNPHSRDAHLNLVQALYSRAIELEREPETAARDARLHELYDQMIESADRVREFDPHNRNVLTFVLHAYRAKADISPDAEVERLTRLVQGVFREYQAQAYQVSDIQITAGADGRAQIQGALTNLNESPGQEVGVQFEILDRNGNVLDRSTARVTLPAVGEDVAFSTTVDLSRGEMAGWRYEVVR